MTETPSVLICCPMGRKLILPDNREFFTGVDWIASVTAQDYPGAEIYALVNDLPESMLEELRRARRHVLNASNRWIDFDFLLTGDTPDVRVKRRKFDKAQKQERFTRFAKLRNIVLDHFLAGDWDYMVSIDSDVMVHPDCVSRLVAQIQEKPGYGMVAGIVNNTRREGMKRTFNKATYNFGMIEPPSSKKGVGRCAPIRKFRRGEFLDVDYAGACAVIDGKMLRSNPKVRWGARKGGEDLFFCERMKEAGFKIGVDTTIVTLHMMDDTVYLEDRATFQAGDFV